MADKETLRLYFVDYSLIKDLRDNVDEPLISNHLKNTLQKNIIIEIRVQ